MSLFRMVVYRVKTVLAWLIAIVVLGLLGFGFYYVTVVGL